MPPKKKTITRKEQDARLRAAVAFVVEKGADSGVQVDQLALTAPASAEPTVKLTLRLGYDGAEVIGAALKLAASKSMLEGGD